MWDNLQPASGKSHTSEKKENSESNLPDATSSGSPPVDTEVSEKESPGISSEGIQNPSQLDMASMFSDLGKSAEETEELFDLIAKAKEIREGSLNGTLTDAERIAQAERTALRLAELFGLKGEDDS